jgi:hypothetical protein
MSEFKLPLPLDGIDRMAISAFKMAAGLRDFKRLNGCLADWASCYETMKLVGIHLNQRAWKFKIKREM